MSNILVLGAGGLLGEALVEFLISKGHTVGALSRTLSQERCGGAKAYAVDILDFEALSDIVALYDIVINCTGQISDPINGCLLSNTEGTKNIVKAVERHDKRVIHVSSVSVYGEARYANEQSALNPQTPYASMKCFSEFLIKEELKDYAILRVSNLFGENQKKGIINYLTQSYLHDRPDIHFDNRGDLKRYYIHTLDMADIVEKTITQELTGIYNVIGPEILSIKELVGRFEDILDYRFNVSYNDGAAKENIDVIDDAKIRELIPLEYLRDISAYIKGLKI